jgi:ribosomal protein S27E
MPDGMNTVDDSNAFAARMKFVRAVLDNCRLRRAAGEIVTDESIMVAHPELMPELGEELRKLRVIAAARERAASPSESDGDVTLEHAPSSKGSRGLRIRCPHCSNFVEVVTDTPFEDISCTTCGSTFSLVDRDESTRMAAPLKSIDRFDLVTRLGVGGFGTVWKARDRDLDRTVAVKIPRRGQLAPSEIDQFFREARAAAQLRHPNIVSVHEVGRDGETLFIVSDFIRGVTLTDWLTANSPSAREVVDLCIPIAEALHHAHQEGVVHRDLKPSNVMLDEANEPHLTDFGLAKREVGEVTMTVDGQILGTPGYMSPEQARGQGHWTDRRTDIYSFGVLLFQLLTGELPFRGNVQMQLHQRLTEDAPDPRSLNRHIPRDLATICLKCLEREPGRRYSTAAELADEFKRYVRGEPIQARPLSAPARLGRWARRKPMVATTAALTVLLAVVGPIVAIVIERQRERLEQLVVEKNKLIDRYSEQKESDAGKIEALTRQLDVWEGRANPWASIWPPKQGEPRRRDLIAKLFAHANATTRKSLQAATHGSENAAIGYLALAILADGAGRNAEAKESYENARDHLVVLRERVPQSEQLTRALAECESALARLTIKEDREKAAKHLTNARETYEKLANDRNDDPAAQIELLESQLFSADLAGINGGQEFLDAASDINRSLSTHWPSNPGAIYRLACFLTGREPMLTVGDGDGVQ